ncbi:MAG: periplasmic heavy metal sensor [Kiritimatiellia bacterium]
MFGSKDCGVLGFPFFQCSNIPTFHRSNIPESGKRLTMWKKFVPLLIVLSVALNVAFVGSWAVHAIRAAHWRAGKLRHGEVWCPLHSRLNVTDAQWQEIEPRLAAFQKSARIVREEVNRRRTELLELIAAAEPDRETLRAKQDEILAGQRRMQDLVIEHLLGQMDVLTPVQQRELFEMMRRRSHCTGQGPGMMPLGSGRREGGKTGRLEWWSDGMVE